MEHERYSRDMTSEELFAAFVMSRFHKTRYPYYGEAAYRFGYLFPTIIVGAANILVSASGGIAKEATNAVTSS